MQLLYFKYMQNKLHTQTKDTQKLSSVFSNTPVQGMFEPPSLVLQQKQQNNSQQPNLKTSLMRAERYGHHLQHTHPNKQKSSQELPIQQQKTLVIGGPANNTTLDQIANPNHPSHDQYIGNAYKYVNSRPNTGLNPPNPTIPQTHRIPDKFGAREAKGWKNLPTRMKGRLRGTSKHGPRKSYQPQGNEKQYLNNLGQNPTLNITAHGTKSGKIGGYKPKKLANLLMNTGLQPGQQGTIDLRACQSAVPGKKHKKSPALKLENELRKRGVNMNVRGFENLIETNQMYEKTNPTSTNRLPARLVDTSQERARLGIP